MNTLHENTAMLRQKDALNANNSIDHLRVTLPPNISEILCRDPKLIGFIAARHKFVGKIFSGMNVLEIGCQEGFGSLLVAPYLKSITCIDFYPPFIDGFKKYSSPHIKNCSGYFVHDYTERPVNGRFDGIFALDVLEHIDPTNESSFWNNLVHNLNDSGTAIIGMPSLESQAYASAASKAGHVNCKSGDDLNAIALQYFENVFMFSMNDENLHNGFLPMSHYLLALCTGKKG
jgi:2-polyprenyl-3-methyl-5-hydroxy-6-metoxy-1,4-benzoquinol methylase